MPLDSPDNFPMPESPQVNSNPPAEEPREFSSRRAATQTAPNPRETGTQPETSPVPYHGNDGQGEHPNGHDSNGNRTIDLSDPRTRAVVEQLMATLSHDGGGEEKVRRGFNPGHYFAILRRRWRPMLAVFVLVCAAISWKMRPTEATYIATTTMLLPSKSPNTPGGAALDPLVAMGLSRGAAGGAVETEIAIITSPMLIQRAINEMPPALKARAAQAAVSAKAPTTPDLINVSVEAEDKTAAIVLANTVSDVYSKRTRELASQRDEERLKQLDEQVAYANKLLTKAKNELQQYKEQTGVFDIVSRHASVSARRQAAQQRVDQLSTEVAAGRASTSVQSDSLETTLHQRANDAKLRYEAVIGDFYPTSPEAIKAERDYKDALELWNRRVDTLMSVTGERLARSRAELAAVVAESNKLPEIENKLSQLTARAMQFETTYRALADRRTNLLVTRNSVVDAATKLTPATDATETGRTWARAILMGLAGALALSILLAALLEHLDNTPHTAEDLEPVLHTSVLGTVPLLKGRSERRLAHVTDKQPAAAALLESSRILRSNLLFSSRDVPLSSVLITSADPGEGKSLCAFNLATVMALDGKRVILLDCDLRRPAQHMLAEIPLEPGLSNLIAGEATIGAALRPTAVANLSLIPAGTLPPNPPELLGSAESRRLIQELKDRCDIVIIDSPPVLSLTDAQVLSSLADGVVMVVAADSTPMPHVQRSQAMLRHVGGRLLGVIFNKAKSYNNPDVWDGYYNYYSAHDMANGNGKTKSLTAPKNLIDR